MLFRPRLSWLRIGPRKAALYSRGIRLKPRLERDLNIAALALADQGGVRVDYAPDLKGTHDARLSRDGGVVVAGINYVHHLGIGNRAATYAVRLPPIIAMFRAAHRVRHAIANVSDAEEVEPGFIGFDSRNDGAVLVADCDFYASHGYSSFRRAAQAAPPWRERNDTMVWRGSTTGHGVIAREHMDPADPTLLPRTAMCLRLRGVAGVDAKLVYVVHSANTDQDTAWLRAAGIAAGPTNPFAWRNDKFAIVIDGNATPWTNLFSRLLLGCCIVRIATRQGFAGGWYDKDLHAWEHFVPVASDMSDLIEKIAWCQSHGSECGEIAARSQEFAMRRTFDSEVGWSIARIEEAFG
jgi:hypothetical protein